MSHLLEDLRAFLDSSPTSWHAAQQLGNRLALKDFQPLEEKEPWELTRGKSYFVQRGGSICAFTLPLETPRALSLLASHTDSPALKIKPNSTFQKENMYLLSTELYGGPLLSSWLNRDLGIAGRVVVSTNSGELEERLVFIDDAPLFIPQLAIHLDREVNEKGLVLNKHDHLNPIATLEQEGTLSKDFLETLLRRHLSFHSLLAYDLFLVPLEKSRFVGASSEMIAAYRLDNLASCHAAACALAYGQAPSKDRLRMAIFWDHEEIGSSSSEGAASPFLMDILKRCAAFYALSEEALICLKQRSLCVSVDVGHAFNPNYSAKYDTNHPVLLGKGVVLKSHALYKYASSAASLAHVIRLCQALNLRYQLFASRADIPCGSTVGPIVAQATGIPTLDLGCPQLSMHSIREVIACRDYLDLCTLLTHIVYTEHDLSV